MKQLNGTDSMFLYSESSRSPLHIGAMLIYNPPKEGEEPVRFRDILRRFEERLHKSPVFRRKLSPVFLDLDAPYWVDDSDFDLEFHVRHMALPKPGDWRQLCILIANLHSRPLDLTRPPWEAYIIEGVDNVNGLPSGSFALYIKIHHSAIDGATGNQMMEVLHDLVPNPPKEQNVMDPWQPEEEPTQLRKLGTAYLKLFKTPKKVQAIVKHAIKSRSSEIRKAISGGTEDHSIHHRTRFNELVSPHRVFGGLRIELNKLKAIKNSVDNATINDLSISLISGAMRHYLLEKGELPENTLVVTVPMSTRTSDNITTEGGNEIANMRLNLRTDIEDPLERLRAISEDAASSKIYANAIGVERTTTVLNSIPSGLVSLGMRTVAATGLSARSPSGHTAISNVPGPQSPLYFCGAEASLMIGVAPLLDGMGLMHSINSYNGYAFLSFVSCRKIMPDPDLYHKCINRSLQEHLVSVGEKPISKSDTGAKKKTKTKAKAKTKKAAS